MHSVFLWPPERKRADWVILTFHTVSAMLPEKKSLWQTESGMRLLM